MSITGFSNFIYIYGPVNSIYRYWSLAALLWAEVKSTEAINCYHETDDFPLALFWIIRKLKEREKYILEKEIEKKLIFSQISFMCLVPARKMEVLLDVGNMLSSL